MALESLTWVLKESATRHSGRLVMIAIADAWNRDLGYAFMYGRTLREVAGLSERAVRNGIAQAVAAGELVVQYNVGGPDGQRGDCNRYWLTALKSPGEQEHEAQPGRHRAPARRRPARPAAPAEPADSAPPPPADSAPPPGRFCPTPRQILPHPHIKELTRTEPEENRTTDHRHTDPDPVAGPGEMTTTIIREVRAATGHTLTDAEAGHVSRLILGRAKFAPAVPVEYVRHAIRRDPAEFVPTPAASRAPAPAPPPAPGATPTRYSDLHRRCGGYHADGACPLDLDETGPGQPPGPVASPGRVNHAA